MKHHYSIFYYLLIPILGRPCQRCIKRSIGHLCHDEPKGSQSAQQQMSGGHNVLPAGILTMQSLPQDGKCHTFIFKCSLPLLHLLYLGNLFSLWKSYEIKCL